MADITFVRREMLPPEAPPGSADRRRSRWARENLFSSWLNAHPDDPLGSSRVWWLVAHIWPWFAHSVWNAGSLQRVPRRSSPRPGARAPAAPASR